ncbi:Probable RNA-directed DNA polymerase from transposon X-element [Eumeta japonica]|uniref:Probable RNA-directed DNA polymerase from transposon X-element n=1 Tax=Eumeta variegata TaxID=151549 RepID=A0A4C1UB16_EUMVA|nr:Probable RNA-directed DNA polymerase from transposon X-element [Eumeta japonica]
MSKPESHRAWMVSVIKPLSASSPLLALLIAIFNAYLKSCYFSSVWKEAVVIGISKPRKPPDLPASYRPISLLNSLGKLYERILKSRLSDHHIKKGLTIDLLMNSLDFFPTSHVSKKLSD